MAIRLVLVDDHAVLLEGLEQLLRHDSRFKVVAKCKDVEQAVRAIDTLLPDIVVLDLRLPGESGLDLLRRRAGMIPPAIVVLTASEDENELLEAVRCGARGVVLKAMATTTLERCIQTVYDGGTWLTIDNTDLAQRLAHRHRIEGRLAESLTTRELDVLRQLACERDNEQIAQSLNLSPGTVRLHVHHVYQKLGVGSRQELVHYLKRRKY
jgi:two-component system nitrate/nitrite response regulator NarL